MPRIPRKPRPTKAPVITFTPLGACVANCTKGTCPRGIQPILEFAPVVSNITHRKRAAFLKIVADIDAFGGTDRDEMLDGLLKQLGVKRSKTCLTCRLINKKTRENPTTKLGACRPAPSGTRSARASRRRAASSAGATTR